MDAVLAGGVALRDGALALGELLHVPPGDLPGDNELPAHPCLDRDVEHLLDVQRRDELVAVDDPDRVRGPEQIHRPVGEGVGVAGLRNRDPGVQEQLHLEVDAGLVERRDQRPEPVGRPDSRVEGLDLLVDDLAETRQLVPAVGPAEQPPVVERPDDPVAGRLREVECRLELLAVVWLLGKRRQHRLALDRRRQHLRIELRGGHTANHHVPQLRGFDRISDVFSAIR
ncbi:hypothetical protein BRC66_03075 [Halobacteriales archaeon QH_2_66_30]|nr:MAG: hypothetical protein BRC66_03075 [Halobacteriales archaeon QH_2_66_30]